MKYFICSFSLIFILVLITSQAYSSPVIPETYFIVNILDKETGKFVGQPSYLSVVEREGDVVLRKYNLTVRHSPSEFSAAWYVPNYREGTVIEISATKDGYTTDKFQYIVKEFGSEKKLFEHTFYLQRIKAEQEIKVQYYQKNFEYGNMEFSVNLATTSGLATIEFNQSLKELRIELSEKIGNGFANVTIPKKLLDGPFVLMRNDFVLHSAIINENATHSIFYFSYGAGQQSLRISGSSAIPEFPWASQLVIVVGLSTILLVGFILKRLHVKNSIGSFSKE